VSPLAFVLALASVALLIAWRAALANAARLQTSLAKAERELKRAHEEVTRIRAATEAAVHEARKLLDQQLVDASAETERVRQHYNEEARKAKAELEQALATSIATIAQLEKYQSLLEEEGAMSRVLTAAMEEAEGLRKTANELIEAARAASAAERAEASKRARELQAQADAVLDHATRESGRLVESAHAQAKAIAGDAYVALRDKEALEAAVKAIHNVIEGYGDRYVIPTRSVLDDLAAEFGHTQAGQALAAAREQTRRMVEEGQAATCDYAEQNRRATAIRFVIDAFNGRVDAILSRAKHDNHGTLGQEIRDAFALVNHNGEAFRNARVLAAYMDARLNELKWAVAAQELRLREREEQRRLKEQIREEERARREYEKAAEDAQREERTLEKALQLAQAAFERATAEQRAELEARIAELNAKLVTAEEKNQRALSMAQQTRKGTVYVISNVGSFGDDVFKIGMTRRLEPADRIKELGDASVPFEFDVHAMVSCDDAPTLEARLHREFEEHRINRVNYRKEFFRVSLERLRETIVATGADVSFTMLAEAREYKETLAINRMTPEERARYLEA